MARTRILQSNFTHGEISELLEGRVDLDQYFSSCKTLENMVLREGGGATRRPGTRYVAVVKTPAKFTRIVRYVATLADAYALEFGEGYIRIFKNGAPVLSGGVPAELGTPYVATDLPLLSFTQLNDVLFITSQFYQPRRLERYSDSIWRIRTEPLTVAPSFEYGTRPAATLTPGATSGSGVTFTASVAQFDAADVGRELLVRIGVSAGARAKIVSVTDSTHVVADISADFAGLAAIAATDWTITESYKTGCTPSAKSPVGTTGVTLTLVLGGWRTGDVGKFVHLNGGTIEITSLTSNLIANGTIRSELNATTKAESGAWTLEEAAWSSVNGFPACNEFFQDRHYYAGTLAQPQTFWGSKSGDYVNYASGALDDDAVDLTIADNQYNAILWMRAGRELLLGTAAGEFLVTSGSSTKVITPTNVDVRPQSSYGSAPDVQPIRAGSVVLFVPGSARRLREMVYDWQTDAYVAPDLLLLAEHLTRDYGIAELAHQRQPTSVVWAVLDDGTLAGMTYLREQNVVGWHRHITGPFTADPVSGHRKPLDGLIESVCVIPHPDGTRDQVWLVVKRRINGAITRYVEYFDDAPFFYRSLHTDAAKTYDGTGTATLTLSAVTGAGVTATAGAAFFVAADEGREVWKKGGPGRATITAFTDSTHVTVTVTKDFATVGPHAIGTWGVARSDLTGLSHLEGATIDVIVDGGVVADPSSAQVVVSGGAATAPLKGIKVEAGLHYDATLRTVRPEVQVGGTTQGVEKHVSEVTVRLFESLGFEINGHEGVPFRTSADPMDAPPPLFTGDKVARGLLGWDREGRVTIEQLQPLPLTVLMITGVLGVGQ